MDLVALHYLVPDIMDQVFKDVLFCNIVFVDSFSNRCYYYLLGALRSTDLRIESCYGGGCRTSKYINERADIVQLTES